MAKRMHYILTGLLAGVVFWGVFELSEGWRDTRLFFMALAATVAFSFAALAMLAELGLRRALWLAGGLALAVAALTGLEALSFGGAQEMLQAGHVSVAVAVVSFLPVPFAIAWGLGGRNGWRDYRVLFIESWNIVVRYLAAWLFVGVMFLVLWLLALLLGIVGISALSDVLEEPLAVWLIVGGTLGLGLSVVSEMSDMVSPYLLLRLLRLLVPLVLVVEVIFVAALPLRGLSHLFGQLSAAAILLSTGLASVALISIVADQDDVEAAHGRAMVWSARGLAVLLPLMAGLAGLAIALRVQDYGWTPNRLMAATAALVVAGYGGLYAAAVLTGRGWMGWLRRANGAMALGLIGLGALWLTPLISPEWLSARSQMARFEAGQVRAQDLPLWELAHDWGKAGKRSIEGLRAQAALPGQEELAAQLARLEAAQSRWDMMAPRQPGDATKRVAALAGAIGVLPAQTALPDALAQTLAQALSDDDVTRCASPTAAGNPGCVLIMADFLPEHAGEEALLVQASDLGGGIMAFVPSEGAWVRGRALMLGEEAFSTGGALIDALMAGALAVAPVPVNAVQAGGWKITVQP